MTRRAWYFLIVGLAVTLFLKFVVYREADPNVAAASETIPMALDRLQRVRQMAAMVPGREDLLKKAAAELQTRERGLLAAPTVEQAKALLLEKIHAVASANGIDARGLEQSSVRPLANDYAEVVVGVAFSCNIEQLVNFLAALANQQEILATNEINVSAADEKKKTVNVRLSLSGIVPKSLLPVKKGPGNL
jgi:hypothetical protein